MRPLRTNRSGEGRGDFPPREPNQSNGLNRAKGVKVVDMGKKRRANHAGARPGTGRKVSFKPPGVLTKVIIKQTLSGKVPIHEVARKPKTACENAGGLRRGGGPGLQSVVRCCGWKGTGSNKGRSLQRSPNALSKRKERHG